MGLQRVRHDWVTNTFTFQSWSYWIVVSNYFWWNFILFYIMAISQITQILQIILTPVVHKVHFSPHCYNHSLALIFLTITIITGIADISFSFDLKFPNEQHCCVPFHTPVDHLNISLENIYSYPFPIFYLNFFCYWVVCSVVSVVSDSLQHHEL